MNFAWLTFPTRYAIKCVPLLLLPSLLPSPLLLLLLRLRLCTALSMVKCERPLRKVVIYIQTHTHAHTQSLSHTPTMYVNTNKTSRILLRFTLYNTYHMKGSGGERERDSIRTCYVYAYLFVCSLVCRHMLCTQQHEERKSERERERDWLHLQLYK